MMLSSEIYVALPKCDYGSGESSNIREVGKVVITCVKTTVFHEHPRLLDRRLVGVSWL